MAAADWEREPFQGLQLRLEGRHSDRSTADGRTDRSTSGGCTDRSTSDGCTDPCFCLVVNALPDPVDARPPRVPGHGPWRVILETSTGAPAPGRAGRVLRRATLAVGGRSIVVLADAVS
jgi:hypothetical protein